MFDFSEASLDSLRKDMTPLMGQRMAHVLGVEREAAALGALYLPRQIPELRASALLHDLTKFEKPEGHRSILESHGVDWSYRMEESPKILHEISGAYRARDLYPSLVTEDVFNGIRWHTTGRRDMSLFECLIYLADYMEDTRTFEDCVRLRKYFYDRVPSALSGKKRKTLLEETMVLSLDMTIRGLMDAGKPMDRDTVEARNFFLNELKRKKDE